MNSNYSGMILAAGFGKRMLQLTKDKPKPLIDINGITLLDNSINFLKKLGCSEIIINTHYKHNLIKNLIKNRIDNKYIKIIYEPEILNTGGGVKNASSLFSSENIIVTNSDIYWQSSNLKDAQSLIKLYSKNNNMHLLLSNKSKSFGIKKSSGDFILKFNKIYRFNKGDDVFFYSGFQVFNINVFKGFEEKKFSFNIIWDHLIKKNILYGLPMTSNWYHVGDIDGLKIAKNLTLE